MDARTNRYVLPVAVVPFTVEQCFEDADDLAQEVLNNWGEAMRAGFGHSFSPKFKVLLEATWLYSDARRLADNHREFDALSEAEATKEADRGKAFAREFRTYQQHRLS